MGWDMDRMAEPYVIICNQTYQKLFAHSSISLTCHSFDQHIIKLHYHIHIPLIPFPYVSSCPKWPGMALAHLGPIPLPCLSWSGPTSACPIYLVPCYVQLYDNKLPSAWNHDTDPAL